MYYGPNPDRKDTYVTNLLEEATQECFQNQNYAEAIALTNEVIYIEPDNHLAYYIRGFSKLGLDALNEAEKDFDKALEYFLEWEQKYGDDIKFKGMLYTKRGGVKYDQGKYKEGCDDLEIAMGFNEPQAIELYYTYCQ